MGSIYLPQNLEILAYSSGYTMVHFLKKVKLSSSAVFHACKNQTPLNKKQEDRILKFVSGLGEDWLIGLHALCYNEPDPDRYEACIFGEFFETRSYGDIFLSNMHALRYFLGVDREEITNLTYISKSGIGRIESGEKIATNEELLLIDRALHEKARGLGFKALEVWDRSHREKILNHIPKFAHCCPRKKYTFYNEETQTTILKGE